MVGVSIVCTLAYTVIKMNLTYRISRRSWWAFCSLWSLMRSEETSSRLMEGSTTVEITATCMLTFAPGLPGAPDKPLEPCGPCPAEKKSEVIKLPLPTPSFYSLILSLCLSLSLSPLFTFPPGDPGSPGNPGWPLLPLGPARPRFPVCPGLPFGPGGPG